jgi:hypothetical protein
MTDFKLELKALRLHPTLSRETHCYTATLYLNGKLAAHIDSDGRGGDPDVHYVDPTTRTFIEQHFKDQPKQQVIGDFGVYEYQPDLDTWAGGEINKAIKKQSAARAKRLPKRCAADYRVVD